MKLTNALFKTPSSVKVLAVLILAASTALFTSCRKTDNSDDDDGYNYHVLVNPDYVPIDWNDANVVSADDSTGDYQIQFDNEIPDIHQGSIIAIDQDTVIKYILVLSVTTSGNTLNITSTPAYLTDIFYDSEFMLATSDNAKKKSNGCVIYPEVVYMLDDNGGYHPVYFDKNRKDNTRITHNLWSSPEFNMDGQVISSGDNYSIVLDRMNLSMNLDLEMYLNFGGRTEFEVVGDMVNRYRSRALKVRAELVGTFETEQMIRCNVTGSCRYAPDYDLWKHNLVRPIPIRFIAGGVPIVITLRCDLFRQVELSASGEINAYTGIYDKAVGRVGFEWEQSGSMRPISSFNNDFQFTPPTVEGQGQIQAKAWVFPRVSVMLYDQLGPSFDFMPYLSNTVKGGFREQMLGQSNDYCAWNLDCNTGLDLRCGLSYRFFGYEVWNWSTPKWNAIDIPLYHSPKRVAHLSGRPNIGQSGTVRFNVYDQNYLLRRETLTPLPQIVKFEANGQISSEYGIASNGEVSVTWTPTENDILYAKLYDIDGSVLTQAAVYPEPGTGDCNCNVTTGEWVDLGLPSGLLWASHNVGASSPEGYGNYYAWGETSPKSVYGWSTYAYGSDYDELTKYCNNSSYGLNGFTDNLTVLQSGDDAATANMGGGARMPTDEEWSELLSNTSSCWGRYNGVYGRCFTGTNGSSLFLPAAGYRYGSELDHAGSFGDYWSSSLGTDTPDYARYFGFGSGGSYMGYGDRSVGLSVRAVRQN